ncbi:hypothetical protein BDQ12DRAFT_241892 [Crucibulum laeve]|uniref:Protein kinase domain-containing protein n=1 Tax=Crucibulum laeve TaxID=68775 RepID=A0A5C3LTF9_9AGAR|nr:hypothetical protein BDQ12DRAFT_241892 [Crucibulum laeve]
MKSDASTWGFPKASPDFGMLDLSSITPGRSGQKPSALSRHQSSFCEVKPTPQQGPKSTDPDIVKPIVAQAADYARLHMSARPFQLFSIGLLIFGSQFCVAIFDRGGVRFSPIHDMWTDTGIFIRVVRSLTCHLSSVELGQDPSVQILPDEDRRQWIKDTAELVYKVSESFPTYAITTGSQDSPCWYTIGFPLWVSLSLLGRGTSIWLVQEKGTDNTFVLKNAWRSAGRSPESNIYRSVKGKHPALAEFHDGGDVVFPGHPGRYITVDNLRGISPSSEGDVVLHRLLLHSIGRPLWEYSSEKELLQGIRAALSAHRFLCDQGILHRDISPGNIMLSSAGTQPQEGAEGFLMDLEFAHIKHSSLDITTHTAVPPVRAPGGRMTAPTQRSHTSFEDVKRGATMTGTAQFMAREILDAILGNEQIEREPRHDVESFVYVLGYSVMRKSVLGSRNFDQHTRERLHRSFYSVFGRMRLDDILKERPLGLLEIPKLRQHVSEPMSTLITKLSMLLIRAMAIHLDPLLDETVVEITHEVVLSLLDMTIAQMN